MRHKLSGYILLLILFSFTAPFFSSYTYKFCPSNPENGFICYCIYKDNATRNKEADKLIRSSGTKKQIDSEKFNALTLSLENPHRPMIDTSESEKLIIPYNFFYKGIPQEVPEKPPTV